MINTRYLILILLSSLVISCQTKSTKPSGMNTSNVAHAIDPAVLEKNRAIIEEHVSSLAQSLVAQPVMTPRSGFSGYLAHFKVIKSTTKDSPYAVILDGEGYTADSVPAELQGFADLKGAHPYGGFYAFCSNYTDGTGKDRHDSEERLILAVPGPKGDGMMTIGFADGEVITVEASPGEFDDKKIQSILSVYGRP